jgi:hypothetical protein
MMTGMAVTQYRARRVLVHVHRAASVGTGIAFVVRAVLPHQPWAWIAAGGVAEVVNVAWNAWLVRWAEAARQPVPPPRTAVFPDGAEPDRCPVCGQHDPDGLTSDGWHETCMEWLGDGPALLRLQRAAQRRRDRERQERRDGYIRQRAREEEREERQRMALLAGLAAGNDLRPERSVVVESNCEHFRAGETVAGVGMTRLFCMACGVHVVLDPVPPLHVDESLIRRSY